MGEGYLLATGDGTLLSLRVSPGAKRASVEGGYGESALKMRAAASPVDGKANTEIERFLAEIVGASRPDVRVVRGASGRDKAVLLKDAERGRVGETLSAHLP